MNAVDPLPVQIDGGAQVVSRGSHFVSKRPSGSARPPVTETHLLTFATHIRRNRLSSSGQLS